MNETSSHLTMDELIAHVNGASGTAASQAHLAVCTICQAEVRKWGAAADGVRLLEAGTQPPPVLNDKILDAINNSLPTRSLVPRPGRRPARWSRVALAVAAAVTLVGGGIYTVRAITDSGQPTATTPVDGTGSADAVNVLSAQAIDTECAALKVVAGELESVDGTTVVLRTEDGERVTVTTSKSTEITQQVAGDLGDITDGMTVFVQGEGSDAGTVAAERISLMPDAEKLPALDEGLGLEGTNLGPMMARMGRANGEVTAVDGGTLTVTRSDGTETKVTTSKATTVVKQVDSTVEKLQTGKFTVAVGTPQENGTLAASSIQQNTLTDGVAGPLEGIRPTNLPKLDRDELRERVPESLRERVPDDLFKGLGCNAGSIATTALYTMDI